MTEATTFRKIHELTGPWRLQMDQDNVGMREEWFSPEYDTSVWKTVQVPGAWDFYEHALRDYEGIGWFAVEFDSNAGPADHHYRIRFGRVSIHAKAWLNGHYIGEHTGAYLPFEFDVTEALNRNGPNKLVVRVDNAHRAHWLPGDKVVEWVQYGGILQPVCLEAIPPAHIADLRIETVSIEDPAIVHVDVTIQNDRDPAFSGTLRAEILDGPGGSIVAGKSSNLSCEGDSMQTAHLSFKIPATRPWSLEDPFLYTLQLSLEGDGVADTKSERFGIRTIETAGRQILLNGKPLFIRGVNRYNEWAGHGSCVPLELTRADLERIKALGANTIRTHYPLDTPILDLMDEIGLLLIEEAPLNWWGRTPNADADKAVIDAAEQALETMILRDRNHPCIIAWSMANESKTDSPEGIAAMRRMLRKAKALDSTRLASFTAATTVAGHLAFEEADYLSVNMYWGYFDGDKCRRIRDMDTLIRQPTAKALRSMKDLFGEKPLVMTEFGMPGIYGFHGDTCFTEDFQAAGIEAAWNGILDSEATTGAVLWCWADYHHRRDFIINHAAYGPYGVVTLDRKEKEAAKVLKRLFLKQQEPQP